MRIYLAQRLDTVVLQKSIQAKNRQLILYISDDRGSVDVFGREFTSAERLHRHYL